MELSFLQRAILGAFVGVVVGTILVTLSRQTALLEDMYILAHEQRRISLAKVQREMATAASAAASTAAKESSNNGETD